MNASDRCAWLVMIALMAPVVHVQAEERFTDSIEDAFVDNGRITIKLTAGEHTITESSDSTIRVSWYVDEKDIRKVDAHTEVDGSTARLDIDGPKKNFRTVIEVPRHSDLVVRLSAGDLDIGSIEGDKDIRLRAGDLDIEIGNIDEYGQVEGSLWAGDIDAGPFSQEKSGLFRSVKWKGDGEHLSWVSDGKTGFTIEEAPGQRRGCNCRAQGDQSTQCACPRLLRQFLRMFREQTFRRR